jgi:hypothetical protein
MKKTLKDFPRCNALDADGKQCRKHYAIQVSYHGNPEHYKGWRLGENEVHWVRVNLCITHAIGVGYNFTSTSS